MRDPDDIEDDAREAWQASFDAGRHREVPFETMSGVPVEPVYGDGPYPGQYPYTRGLHASMYRSRLWTMRMFAGFGTAEDTNARFKDLLRHGGTGLSTAFDMPTLMGRDSDSEWALGEVGRAGVAVDTLADMEDLFADIDLGERVDVDDHQRPGRRSCWPCTSPSPRRPASARAELAGTHPERHPQGVPGAEGVHLSRRARRCASSPT